MNNHLAVEEEVFEVVVLEAYHLLLPIYEEGEV
jgi:hypothetical protein